MRNSLFVFPSGLPGAALVLLRASVAVSTFSVTWPSAADSPWLSMTLHVLAFTIIAGIYTRIGSGLIAAFALVASWQAGWTISATIVVHGLDAIALAVIGPGLYSIDGGRFGRRTLHLPRRLDPMV